MVFKKNPVILPKRSVKAAWQTLGHAALWHRQSPPPPAPNVGWQNRHCSVLQVKRQPLPASSHIKTRVTCITTSCNIETFKQLKHVHIGRQGGNIEEHRRIVRGGEADAGSGPSIQYMSYIANISQLWTEQKLKEEEPLAISFLYG